MPSSAASVKPSAFTVGDELLQVARVLEHRLGDREPAQPVADLGPGAAPERLVLAPDARGDVLLHRRLRRAWRAAAPARRAATSRWSAGRPVTAASLRDSTPAISLSNGVDERRDAVREQLVGHVAHVDARLGERVEHRRVGSWSAVAPVISDLLGRREQRGHRHRVHRVGATRPSTYFVSGYAGFLTPVEAHSGRCTGAPASRSAAKRSPAEDALEALVGGLRVGDRGLALQVLAAELLQALVHLGVHARDEEAGDRVHVERLARLVAALQALDVAPRSPPRRPRPRTAASRSR